MENQTVIGLQTKELIYQRRILESIIHKELEAMGIVFRDIVIGIMGNINKKTQNMVKELLEDITVLEFTANIYTEIIINDLFNLYSKFKLAIKNLETSKGSVNLTELEVTLLFVSYIYTYKSTSGAE